MVYIDCSMRLQLPTLDHSPISNISQILVFTCNQIQIISNLFLLPRDSGEIGLWTMNHKRCREIVESPGHWNCFNEPLMIHFRESAWPQYIVLNRFRNGAAVSTHSAFGWHIGVVQYVSTYCTGTCKSCKFKCVNVFFGPNPNLSFLVFLEVVILVHHSCTGLSSICCISLTCYHLWSKYQKLSTELYEK